MHYEGTCSYLFQYCGSVGYFNAIMCLNYTTLLYYTTLELTTLDYCTEIQLYVLSLRWNQIDHKPFPIQLHQKAKFIKIAINFETTMKFLDLWKIVYYMTGSTISNCLILAVPLTHASKSVWISKWWQCLESSPWLCPGLLRSTNKNEHKSFPLYASYTYDTLNMKSFFFEITGSLMIVLFLLFYLYQFCKFTLCFPLKTTTKLRPNWKHQVPLKCPGSFWEIEDGAEKGKWEIVCLNILSTILVCL